MNAIKNNDKKISKNKSITQNKKTRWWQNAKVKKKTWIRFYSQIGWRPFMVHTTLEVKLDGEWTPFVSHNGGSQASFLFLATQK